MNCIVLMAEQAEAVRGETSPGYALQPILLADGNTYVLPAGVLDHPAYDTKLGVLLQLPQRDIGKEEFVQPEPGEPEPEPTVTWTLSADEVAEIEVALKGNASVGLQAKLQQAKA